MVRIVAILVILSAIVPAGFAVEPGAAPKAPPALSTPIAGGLVTAKQFEGPSGSGLTGWLMHDASGTYYTFWTTSDGNHLLAGALINERGENLTQQYQEKYEPKPDLPALWPRLAGAAQIVTGSKAKSPRGTLWVFVDPNCPYCHAAWLALKAYAAAGLEVHWVVVGFLHQDSLGKAAALLSDPNPAAAFEHSQLNFQSGGVTPLQSVQPELTARLSTNLELMHSFGFKGVPGFVYRDAEGVIHTRDGMPRLHELPAMTGLPAQETQDPALERFK